MRRLGSVAALAAADVVGVVVAAAAEQSVVVSSIQLEMRMRCDGVEWVRQPQTPILELEPETHQEEIYFKIYYVLINQHYLIPILVVRGRQS